MNPIIDGQQPSWRLWGEEKSDGAVYTVYLKKVRYHPSSSLSRHDSEDSVSHLEWETVRVRVIKAGPLEAIVANLADDEGGLEPTNVNVFLATYRSFATPQQVLDAFQARFRELKNRDGAKGLSATSQRHHQSLVQTLLVWLDMYPEDLYEPPQFSVLHQLVALAQAQLEPGSNLELRAKHRLQQFIARDPEKDGPFFKPPPWNVVFGTSWPGAQARAQVVGGPLWLQDLDEEHIACQLTWMDADLFRRLVPHHCLSAMWRKRGARDWAGTVHNTATATVQQFNAVSRRVTSTLLWERWDEGNRVRLLAKWIGVAQELRLLKNFSSLKAVIAALQSNDIYRLSSVWARVTPDRLQTFLELARIFSSEDHRLSCRELMLKEGTAKFADTVGDDDRQLQKAMQRQQAAGSPGTMQGTVPYLGIFLTDLTMLDAALPDELPGGLLNFDKRRREFRVLAQIKLLQSAANCYSLQPDPAFVAWFETLPMLSDEQSYRLSCKVEPASSPKRSPLSSSGNAVDGDTASLTSTSSQPQSGGSQESLRRNGWTHQRPWQSTGNLQSMMSACPPPTPPHDPDLKVIRVSLDPTLAAGQGSPSGMNQGTTLYKSILLSNGDHTPTVVRNALEKHGLEGDPDEYELTQQLPDSEIVFPPSANVFYALSTAHALNFILRQKKSEPASPVSSKKSRKPFQLKLKLPSGT
uniref:Ral guanine nucleotide dissociation stimulator-like 1 n=1 Tax=Rhipicephalus appendiculatus TaxID=34631 RepID=A0A131Z525_RHIAP